MDNNSFEKSQEGNQKLMEEGSISENKTEKKFDYKNFINVITFATAFAVTGKLVELTSIESTALRILFRVAIITVVVLIEKFIVTMFSKRKK